MKPGLSCCELTAASGTSRHTGQPPVHPDDALHAGHGRLGAHRGAQDPALPPSPSPPAPITAPPPVLPSSPALPAPITAPSPPPVPPSSTALPAAITAPPPRGDCG
nr:vegetative cell wall protein gp1-like [Chelonoidis abingdonii]